MSVAELVSVYRLVLVLRMRGGTQGRSDGANTSCEGTMGSGVKYGHVVERVRGWVRGWVLGWNTVGWICVHARVYVCACGRDRGGGSARTFAFVLCVWHGELFPLG